LEPGDASTAIASADNRRAARIGEKIYFSLTADIAAEIFLAQFSVKAVLHETAQTVLMAVRRVSLPLATTIAFLCGKRRFFLVFRFKNNSAYREFCRGNH
jgi:hypothetical protein